MLTITRDATEAIRYMIQSSAETADDLGGLRLVESGSADGRTEYSITLAGEPEIGDEVIENDGARVFVEHDLAPLLDGKQLDVDETKDGRIRFLLQAPA